MVTRLVLFGILVIWLFTNVVTSDEEAAEFPVESAEPDDNMDAIEELGDDSNMETSDSVSIIGNVLDRKRKPKRRPKKGTKKPAKGSKRKPRKPTKGKGRKPKKPVKGKKPMRPGKVKGRKPMKPGKGKKPMRPGKGRKPGKGGKKPGKDKGRKPGKGGKKPGKGKGKKPGKGGKKPGIRPTGKPRPKPKPSGGSCKKPSFCGASPDNSLCKYSGPAKGCKPFTDDAAFKAAILTEHNKIRRKVASGGYAAKSLPAATGSGIPDLQWDEGLACLAQRWADQCNFGHDKSRKTAKFSYAGQNAYMSSSKTGNHGGAASKMWFEAELPDWHKYKGNVKEFGKSGVSYPTSGGKKFWYAVGHLTQVIWAKTTHIGCGQATGSGGTVVVCNYGPGGNMSGGVIYPTA